MQTACRIIVTKTNAGSERLVVWDSGRLSTAQSQGIPYEGEALRPCTRYYVRITVWGSGGAHTEKETFFETGFLDSSMKPWGDARWIAAPCFSVAASTRGVFVIESRFRLCGNSRRAGIVFGANDFRLMDHLQNEYGLEGENYIRYEINLDGAGKKCPSLDIYRVGYAREDQSQIPFARVPLSGFKNAEGKILFSEEQWREYHVLKIVVDGNNGAAYLDDVPVDGSLHGGRAGSFVTGRTLNPRGENDVQTYPRLNEIGLFAGPQDEAVFEYLQVSNLRTPSRVFIRETAAGGLNGRRGIFEDQIAAGVLECRDGVFTVRGGSEKGTQVTADPSNTSIPMFRSTFFVEGKRIASARLFITARGIYDCRINGQAITGRVLPPGLTQYDCRMNYQTYDVTEYVKSGLNGIGVTLASGWWSDAQTYTVKNYNYWGDKESFLCRLVVTCVDGSETVLVSDEEHWSYFGEGPYTYAGLFNGEHYDARLAEIFETYSRADFAEQSWESPVVDEPVSIGAVDPNFGRVWPAVHQDKKAPKLEGGYDAPVYVVETRQAAERREVETGTWLYDLKQEMAGVPRITFHEKAGTKVIIRYAEVLYPDIPQLYHGNVGRIMVENYRDAASTDVYICRGTKDGEVYQPRFTFHGYRYIEISGVTRVPELSEVESLQYSSVTNMEGTFVSSDRLLNRFAENVRWSQLCNFINIPTDCPQRNERMGWLGDTHVFCHTALNNSYLKLFYERNIQAMIDLQDADGRFPEIAPIGGGFGGITYECAPIFMTWELYRQYRDLRSVERVYPALKKYMVYMSDKGMPGRAKPEVGPLGDWLAPEETDEQLLWNAFYFREATLMAELARLTGDETGAAEYRCLAENIRSFWNKVFLDPADGRTRTMDGTICDTQTSYAIAIAYDLVEDKKQAAGHLARKAKALDYTVGTGFFGTGLVCQALSDQGYGEDAWKMMLQTKFPSWLYPVTQGATTIWEHWDSLTEEAGFGENNAMNSFNHYSLGSVLSWLYEYVLGIRRDGEAHFIIQPHMGNLKFAGGSVSSPYGTVYCRWEMLDGKIRIECRLPVNTQATVQLPDGTEVEIGSGEHAFELNKIGFRETQEIQERNFTLTN